MKKTISASFLIVKATMTTNRYVLGKSILLDSRATINVFNDCYRFINLVNASPNDYL